MCSRVCDQLIKQRQSCLTLLNIYQLGFTKKITTGFTVLSPRKKGVGCCGVCVGGGGG